VVVAQKTSPIVADYDGMVPEVEAVIRCTSLSWRTWPPFQSVYNTRFLALSRKSTLMWLCSPHKPDTFWNAMMHINHLGMD
jgi:hypothetical protein